MAVYLVFLGGVGRGSDYAMPRRWLTPSRSRAWRCSGGGVVMRLKAGRAGSAGWILVRPILATPAHRGWGLFPRTPPSGRLATGLAPARRGQPAGGTTP